MKSDSRQPAQRSHRKAYWFTALILLLAACGFMAHIREDRTPTHNGVPISVFVVDLARSPGSASFMTAASVVKELGTNAVPYYVEQVSSPLPLPVQLHQRYSLRLPPWIQSRLTSWMDPYASINRKLGSLRAIEILGPIARPWTEELRALLQTAGADEIGDIAKAIEAVGANAGNAVAPLLQHSNLDVQLAACGAIQHARTGPEAIPHLISILKQENPKLHQPVIWVLSSLEFESIPALKAELQSADPEYVLRVLKALNSGSLSVFAAVPELIQFLDSDNQGHRILAAQCLAGLIVRFDINRDRELFPELTDEQYLSYYDSLNASIPALVQVFSEHGDEQTTPLVLGLAHHRSYSGRLDASFIPVLQEIRLHGPAHYSLRAGELLQRAGVYLPGGSIPLNTPNRPGFQPFE